MSKVYLFPSLHDYQEVYTTRSDHSDNRIIHIGLELLGHFKELRQLSCESWAVLHFHGSLVKAEISKITNQETA